MPAMKPWSNSEQRYGMVAIGLHWAMAALVVGLLALGLYMVRLPDVGFDTEKITLILVHKAVGMLALLLLLLRFAWRLRSALPRLADGLPDWQQVAARFVHLMFYALMFALPVTGWLMSSAGGYPVPFFSFFNMPDLIGLNDWLFQVLIDVHRWLAWLLLLFLLLHAAAALRHHFGLRDDTLQRMLP
jgi:cytochrome b561